ncbi:D-glycero-beta-D-manno-heptose-1,7-bisphosphate 7-phosphatase [Zobellella endophytica]|uniref:D,D-heptose 1,7-bisphosphate phosphatase n=1 Tax=Zobellella endophytica TaxID=2116700 RepID=A0A2P7R0U6_9GAMM|nr:D-glycero-beta-D-manno-heptose 1,7-bisphosphate 7-phosphatase [Zobellella endophytica]PSJ43834.1 D-glycero-beta-D-manno-heptose-1,7-bisphosphate 7-phosphatase [Zobellella endophytica]
MATAAIFLDRDGVINKDTGYVSHSDDFIFIDGVIDAMKQFKQKGFLLVVVTNQSGIARGLFSEDDFMRLTEWMDWSLADRGVDLDGIYFCPHHPSAGNGPDTRECDCRKPAPGMLLDAAKELNIDLAASYMVGDKVSDMKAAETAGVGHKILVRTGKAITEEGEAMADAVYPSLVEFAQNIA